MIIKQVHILSTKYPLIFLLLIALMWIGLYSWLDLIARFLVALLPVAPDGHFGKSLQFFFYDTPKVLLLLTSTVFIMGIVHTFISPEVTRALLSGKRLGLGNILAATLGIVTPFCSCSAVPLFIGFLQAGVPLGVTFSFLIAAPMVNEVALVLLLGLFGWKIAIFYLSMGLLIAIVAGLLIGNLNMERYLEDWVQAMQNTRLAEVPNISMTWGERIHHGFQHAHDIVIKVWSYIVLGIGLGALIHGYIPESFMVSFMGSDAWWAVPAAVLLGIPLYTNAAGIIPVVQALLSKGAALGTVLAFMMSVIALSAPEMLILRKVLRPQLIITFVGIVATGILLVGYVFNWVL